MSLSRFSRRSTVETEMNVTPMIDVLLVLLVIYMLAMRTRMAIDVATPSSPPVAATPEVTPIVLAISQRSVPRINGQPVPIDALDSVQRSIYDRRPAKLLFIEADTLMSYQDVIGFIDRARGAGVSTLSFVPPAPSR